MTFHLRSLSIAVVLTGALTALSAACGDANADNANYGKPPDPSSFDPGGGGSDPYGQYGSALPGKPECPVELKRCTHTVTFPVGTETTVELRGDFGGAGTWEHGVPMTKKGNVWTADILVPIGVPIQYKFFVDGQWKVDLAQGTIPDGTGNTNNTFTGGTCDPAVCSEEGELPPGVFDWRDSVIYFVFVDRFFNGNTALDAACKVAGVSGPSADYAGGDWPGVTKKINEGYFSELGVNTLWITVPFNNANVTGKGTAPDDHLYSGYHGYWPKLDAADPTALQQESCFGSFDDLKALVSAAHAKGLKVLFDYAMVHVHASSGIFQTHGDWFWPNSKNGSANCVCSNDGACTWNNDYQRCWFTDYLPHWNYTVPAARAWSVANAVSWITKTADASGNGVDGFRADAIKHVDVSWLTELRAKIKTDVTSKQSPAQRFYMVGETFEFGDRGFIKSFVDPETKLDGQFDFPLRANIVQSTLIRTEKMSDLAAFMDSNDYFYGASSVMSTFIGNHDLPRIIHLAASTRPWGDNQGADGKDRSWDNLLPAVTEIEAYERVANAFAVLFTNRGAPLVYYGDEIGLPGGGDPDNRRPMPWGSLDANQTFLKNRVKLLADIRSKHPALRRGTRATLSADADTWTFVRQTTGDTVYVAINRSDVTKQVGGLPSASLEDLVSGQLATGPTVSVSPRQTRIFVVK